MVIEFLALGGDSSHLLRCIIIKGGTPIDLGKIIPLSLCGNFGIERNELGMNQFSFLRRSDISDLSQMRRITNKKVGSDLGQYAKSFRNRSKRWHKNHFVEAEKRVEGISRSVNIDMTVPRQIFKTH